EVRWHPSDGVHHHRDTHNGLEWSVASPGQRHPGGAPLDANGAQRWNMVLSEKLQMKRSTAPLILILAGLGSVQLVRGQAVPVLGPIQDLPGLGRVQAINKSGQIAGFTGTGDEIQGVLIDKSGAVTKISVPGSDQTRIYGMDNSTRIVGAYNLPDH